MGVFVVSTLASVKHQAMLQLQELSPVEDARIPVTLIHAFLAPVQTFVSRFQGLVVSTHANVAVVGWRQLKPKLVNDVSTRVWTTTLAAPNWILQIFVWKLRVPLE